MSEKLKRTLLVALLVLSLIPPLLLVSWPSIVTVNSVGLWVADTLGFMGITLLIWMYLLGAKSVMGLFFHDLAPVLAIHKWIGKFAVPAIFLHPLLITLSFGESLLYSFMPQLGTFYERNVTLGRIAFLFLLITWLGSAIARGYIKFRPWKYLHYLAYICVPFALLHIPNVGSHYISSVAVKTYFFTLVTVYIIIMVLRLRGILNLDKLAYTIIDHTQISDTDYVLNLKPTSLKHIAPKRGQFIYVKLGIISEDHPFSVLKYDPTTNNLAVGYRVYGEYTRVMSRLNTGDTVYIGGPYGAFMSDFASDNRPTVFISGGIGITPFVDQIIQNSTTREQWLFAANRTRNSAVMLPEVAPYLGKNLVRVYSKEASEPQAGEVFGHISTELLQSYLGDLTRYSFYLCGPPKMMEAMKTLLVSANVPSEHTKSEAFGW